MRLSAFKAWSSSEPLKLSWWVATLSVPVNGANIGDTVSIYYSEDNGVSWYPQSSTTVTSVNGEPYAIFTTDHFTEFAVTLWNGAWSSFTGSFVINNDNTSTNSDSVTLNISTTPPAAQMRFSNDWTSRSGWETYATTKTWTLSAGYGNKIVYAQFDTDNDTNTIEADTTDTINYVQVIGNGCWWSARNACISLDILSWAISCTSPTSIRVGSTGASFAQRVLPISNAWSGDNFACTDLKGSDMTRDLQLQGDDSDLLDINNAGSGDETHYIPRSNVSITATNDQIPNNQWSCSHSSTGGTLNNVVNLLSKTGNEGEICTIDFANGNHDVWVTVTIPGDMAVGAYQGTMIVTYPS